MAKWMPAASRPSMGRSRGFVAPAARMSASAPARTSRMSTLRPTWALTMKRTPSAACAQPLMVQQRLNLIIDLLRCADQLLQNAPAHVKHMEGSLLIAGQMPECTMEHLSAGVPEAHAIQTQARHASRQQ